MKFFEPTSEFVKWLKDYADDRIIVDCGCGDGQLVKMLNEIGGKAIGVDFIENEENKKLGSAFICADVTDPNFSLFYEMKDKILPIFCRPCHSNFVDDVISRLNENVECLYVGRIYNVDVDIDTYYYKEEREDAPLLNDSASIVLSVYRNRDKTGVNVKSIMKKREIDEWKLLDEYSFKLESLPHNSIDEDDKRKIKDNPYKDYSDYKELYSAGYIGEKNDIKFWENLPKKYYDFESKRPVEIKITTYYVGGGHYHVSIKEEDNECVSIDHEQKEINYFKPDAHSKFFSGDYKKYEAFNGIRNQKNFTSLFAAVKWIEQEIKEFQDDKHLIYVDYLDNIPYYEDKQ